LKIKGKGEACVLFFFFQAIEGIDEQLVDSNDESLGCLEVKFARAKTRNFFKILSFLFFAFLLLFELVRGTEDDAIDAEVVVTFSSQHLLHENSF
jgi:hypothetical protein